MAEIDGARQRLDLARDWLRDRILDLAAELDPERVPTLRVPAEPSVVDWHTPLRYSYAFTALVAGSDEQYDPGLPERAARWLTGTGWTVATEVTRPAAGPDRTTVTGLWNDYRLRVRTEQNLGGILYMAETPAIPLAIPEPWVPPPPVRTPETVSRGYVLCYECDGAGWCPECKGRGWVESERGRETCGECLGDRDCPVCRGHGELAVNRLQDWQRNQYPDLRGQS